MSHARLSLVVLYSEHLEECRAFYAALGLPLVPEKHGTGPDHYAAELGETVVELYPAGGRPTGRARIGLDVEGAAADPPLTPGRHLLTDPDGRTVDVLAH
ncbi:glyoxalase/bleomycin resistance/dioxygenase family protein [Nocardiopsis sp. HNM0947]|uniref:Glyoxalase/bleomycin resistance/dioxygenase family protein n=1 Tax=Nocardiopsis coralli TaxID=2772213 RepID=A0ABR9P0L8_9ACTN|nr:glyoxalase/bleomycin resistance/dioxygenase family protein [Nocardiopsis coralli]MBE2997376.1 glyoxalase/bleomycin resistance/dioxygenase family protein [Nocardiopsis coralli]